MTKSRLQKITETYDKTDSTVCFKLTPPPPLYLDENSAITRGEGRKPNSSPKPKTLAKKDNLSRKIAHNTIQTIEVGRRDIVLFS